MAVWTAAQRREEIGAILAQAGAPVSAAALAARFSVSRQIIVGDIALLRAAGAAIAATPRGYVLSGLPGQTGVTRQVACVHTPDKMGQELYAIVDAGGEAVDVVVEHPVYGQLTGALHLRSRYDVDDFLAQVARHGAQPLSALTAGVHLHTLRCPDQATLDRVITALSQGGFLYRDDTAPRT